MSSMKPLQDLKKFSFTSEIGDTLIDVINLDMEAKFMISKGFDLVVFTATKNELKSLIEDLSALEKGLKNS